MSYKGGSQYFDESTGQYTGGPNFQQQRQPATPSSSKSTEYFDPNDKDKGYVTTTNISGPDGTKTQYDVTRPPSGKEPSKMLTQQTVSYTHLTLPTKRIV